MSDKFYTSFYVDDGEVTYSNVKPTEVQNQHGLFNFSLL